jgi:hypothetical protein
LRCIFALSINNLQWGGTAYTANIAAVTYFTGLALNWADLTLIYAT